MSEMYLYKLLKYNRHKFTKQQCSTIRGQIRKGDLEGAYKGIRNLIDAN